MDGLDELLSFPSGQDGGGIDGDLRWGHRRILRDRQGLDRWQARQHDHDGDHPGENRAVDEKARHGKKSLL